VFRLRGAVLLLAVGLCPACAKTRMTSSVSPTASGANYSRILVVFPAPDLRVRAFVEDEFTAEVPTIFIPGYSLLPPVREYSNDEVLKRLNEAQIDALLLVKLSDAGTSSKSVQASRANACARGSQGRRGCFQGFTASSGGGSINQAWAFFQTSLMDMNTLEVVWTGSAQSKGSQFSGSDDVLRSMVKKAVERLREDGLVGEGDPPPAPKQVAEASDLLFSYQAPTWFEDGWGFYDLSSELRETVYGARFGRTVFDLLQGTEVPDLLSEGLSGVTDAFFGPADALWRRGTRDGVTAWWVQGPAGLRQSPLPDDAAPRISPDGETVAYYRGTAGSGPTLFVGPFDAPIEHDLDGLVTGMGWTPDGSAVLVLVFEEDGTSTLHRVNVEGGNTTLLRSDLDAPARFNSIAVSADGRVAYLSLVGVGAPDPEARHDPEADRDLDIYRVRLSDGTLEPVVTTPGDDFRPLVLGENLYWTHNDYRESVVALPMTGGTPHEVSSDGQIPYWSADGSQVAFTVGSWMLSDWALNMDAWVVDVDDEARVTSESVPIVEGYHEDFTPAWSPDGRWIAYHSHRSPGPVAHYFAEGGTDDIYIRHPDAPMSTELRLMDFGWEVGMADWDRSGTRLYFDSWERGGPRGVSHPWIATIDPTTGQATAMDPLPLPEGFGGTVLASWSPVTDELAVVEHIEGERYAIWMTTLDGSVADRLFEYRASTYGGVDWTPDGRNLVYGALTPEGRMQIFSFDLEGGVHTQLTVGPDDHIQPQVSPDGRWIATSRLRHLKELRRLAIR
jgi:Tol biopolymer transport system component